MSPKKNKSSRERMKLAVIPLLVLLLGVICWPSDSEDTQSHPSRDRLASVTSASAKSTLVREANEQKNAVWPTLDLELIVAQSPFDRGPAIRKMFGEEPEVTAPAPLASGARTGEAAEEAAESKTIDYATIGTLQAVLQSESGLTALIDSQVIRTGETIAGGKYRVVEITPRAVLVEPVVLPGPPDVSPAP